MRDLAGIVRVQLSDDFVHAEPEDAVITINDRPEAVWLRAMIDGAALCFSASPDGQVWMQIGGVFDAGKLFDDYGSTLHFTGTMIGIACRDIAGERAHADFEFFEVA